MAAHAGQELSILRNSTAVASKFDIGLSSEPHNAGLQLRRATSIQAEGKRLLEKHATAPSAARLCSASGLSLLAHKMKASYSRVGFPSRQFFSGGGDAEPISISVLKRGTRRQPHPTRSTLRPLHTLYARREGHFRKKSLGQYRLRSKTSSEEVATQQPIASFLLFDM